MDTSCVKQSDKSKYVAYWEEPHQRNVDNNTNYYDTPKYVVHVLGGAVSKTYRRISESRDHRQVITTLSRVQVITVETALIFCSEVR